MLKVDAVGHVLRMIIARPESRNALDLEMMEALAAAWRRLRDDDDLWLGVLTAEGQAAFSSGADLKKLPGQLAERRRRGLEPPATVFADDTLDKPIVCAINGDALGGGLELALVCDLRLCAAHARLGAPEARWGVMPAGGATQRLPRLVGLAAATRLLLTGDLVSADEALRLGLVDAVHPSAELEAATAALCARLLANAPLALRAIKRALRAGQDGGLRAGLEAERREADLLLETSDAREGVRAFVERRAPAWTAR